MSRFLSQHILSKSRALPIASTTSRIHCRKNFSLLRAVTSETPFCKRLTNCHNAIRSFSAAGGSGFKPWENPVIESDGDYRTETFLEDHIGGPLYENQNDLPRLPIPSIEETLERFLPTALPLAKNEEEVRALREACEAFPEQAKILQERLKRRSEEEMTNTSWLQLWWNQVRTCALFLGILHLLVLPARRLLACVFTISKFSCGQCLLFLSIQR